MKHLPSFSWSVQPFSRLTIFFASGCLISKAITFSHHNILIQSCIGFFLFSFLTYLYFKNQVILKQSIFSIRGCLIWALFLFAGLLNGILSKNVIPSHLNSFVGKNLVLFIQLDSEPRIKSGILSIDCNILKILNDKKYYSLDSKIRLQIKHGSPDSYQFAQRKLILGKLFYPNPSSKPGEFDYVSSLKSKGISSVIRIDSSNNISLPNDEFSFQRLAFNWRSSIIKRFHHDVLKPEEKQVASALLLGDRSEMNSEILKEYSSGGIIHILAVSGLHVGLVYQLCIWIFKYFKFLKRKRFDMLLIITILWVYAAMTGLSPSVNRAVCMFTLLSFADFLNRKVSPFNILSSAAFLLLLIKPDAIFDMGFQLSFAAVWGILSARPILDKLKLIVYKFLTFILTPIIISIVAQIATAPFSLYAFGTFPTWFLPANLIAVPLSTILTYLGISALVFSNVPFIGKWLMILFSLGIRLLNDWAQFISTLPHAQLCNLKIGLIELVCYSIAIYILFYSFKKRSFKNYVIFLCSLFVGTTIGFFNSIMISKMNESLIFTSTNTLHFHSYTNTIDHHFVLFSNASSNILIPEFEKLIHPDFIHARQVLLHPILISENHKTTNKNVFLLKYNKLIQFDFCNSTTKLTSKHLAIVTCANDDTFKYLEKNKSFLKCIIPVPWINSKQKIRIKNFASKWKIEYYDPEQSGWLKIYI